MRAASAPNPSAPPNERLDISSLTLHAWFVSAASCWSKCSSRERSCCRDLSALHHLAEETRLSNYGSSTQALSQPPAPRPGQKRREARAASDEHSDRKTYPARPQTMVGVEELLDEQQPARAADLCAIGHCRGSQWLVEYICILHEHAGDLAAGAAVK